MKIEYREITVRDLTNGYVNNAEEGVTGFGGDNLEWIPKEIIKDVALNLYNTAEIG